MVSFNLFTRKNSRKDFKLPSDFKWKSYHSMRVERNMNQLLVWIDEIPAVGQSCFTDLPYDSSIPGIFIESGTAAFDGALYTIGLMSMIALFQSGMCYKEIVHEVQRD